MDALLYATLLVAGIACGLWFFVGRHAPAWAPSGPDPAALDSPEAVATVLRLATEAHQATKADEVVRLMGWLFRELPADEVRALVREQGRAWLAATAPRVGPAVVADLTVRLDEATAAAAARDFAAGRDHMYAALEAVNVQGFAHPGAALIAAGMNGAWAHQAFGPTRP